MWAFVGEDSSKTDPIHFNGMNIFKGRDGSVAYQIRVENLSQQSAELQHCRNWSCQGYQWNQEMNLCMVGQVHGWTAMECTAPLAMDSCNSYSSSAHQKYTSFKMEI